MRGGPLHPPALTHGVRRGFRSRRGFTLVEVLLALALLATVGSLVAGMLYSASSDANRQQHLRRRNIKAEVISARLDGTFRGATKILAAGDSWVVLWKGDTRPDEKPNLSELRRIEWDAANKLLRAYAAPPTLTEADDTAYAPSADFAAATAAIRNGPNFPGETWCERVTDWQLAPSGANTATRLLGYTMTLEDPAGAWSFKSVAGLRAE